MLFESVGITNVILIITALVNMTICLVLLRILRKLQEDKAK